MKRSLIVVSLISLSACTINPAQPKSTLTVQDVQRICDTARAEHSGVSEGDCGFAQEITNTEYLCTNIGNSPTIECWIETKDGN